MRLVTILPAKRNLFEKFDHVPAPAVTAAAAARWAPKKYQIHDLLAPFHKLLASQRRWHGRCLHALFNEAQVRQEGVPASRIDIESILSDAAKGL